MRSFIKEIYHLSLLLSIFLVTSIFSLQADDKIHSDISIISASNDEPISVQLFADIIDSAAGFLKNVRSDYRLFIKKEDDISLPKGTKLQKWIFFNQEEFITLLVTLTDDGYGGSYFSITQD